ncbi:MAG TPA: D-glycero-beta-D-manno-heptose-1,7-bisphosphate 7-phosphatase [Chromatiaceae bacterium]|nr:MAG: D-glycero-beta-D-manno-heptose 1,7-bisphosphate 7-phosphatase [Thiohalocapsa sp. PB-PSB1]HBG94624.1 D-glycero-beta-D-manno-heptose-1,7-bisphosphate 7-phosphatase [Chromatiaceae bacterium]HCS91113.1 D-glycero-beta-D-manno-heptose-1,7-bisphosphate 7-phosphatase [Chromatiaceae bacterium]
MNVSSTHPTRLVILDRDGVINADSNDYIKSPAEWRPLPGSLAAIAALTNAGRTVAVATNQSGVARGLFDIDTLNRIHSLMSAQVVAMGGRIDAVVFCPHGPDQHCACRKPRTGMLLALARRFGVSLRGVPVVGDSLRDLEAALSVDAIPILVRSGKGEITAKQLPESLSGIKIVDDLKAAVDYILQQVDL